ncbi:SDR family oxidoreductase [Planosporangium sp. 12N6]|uniref:SDR family oxidoreductase n=1 Tax=Planosporangium spinosum TaxID=3402278 RepID=UPI003CED5C7E
MSEANTGRQAPATGAGSGRHAPATGADCGRRVLVTGAGSGLGRAIAARFAADGCRVLLTDVNADAVAEAAAALGDPSRIAALSLDVTDDDAWARARVWCEENWGGLDILVNNAGVAAAGRVDAIPIEDWRWILETNLMSAVRGCRTFVPLLKAQGHGHVVNVASLAGLLTPPAMSSYNVTKAAVVALSETLRSELEPYGIRTTVVCPGFVRTNLASSVRSPDPAMVDLTHKLVNGSKLTPEQVADRVVVAVDRGRFLVLTELVGRVAWLAKRYVPALVHRQTVAAARRLRARIESGHVDGRHPDSDRTDGDVRAGAGR